MSDCKCKSTQVPCDSCCEGMGGVDHPQVLPPLGVVEEVQHSVDDNGVDTESHIYHKSEEIRQQMADDHESHYRPVRRSVESSTFEDILKSMVVERTELEQEEAQLVQRLSDVRARLHDVYPIEGTLTWVQHHVFDNDQIQGRVREILPSLSPVYNELMLNYHRLRNRKGIKVTDQGIRFVKFEKKSFPYVCELCQSRFQHEGDLALHVESKCEYHGNEEFKKDYEQKRELRSRTCDVCGFVSKSVSGLNTHMRKHLRSPEDTFRKKDAVAKSTKRKKGKK